jgi:histone arginine demethylase JMJD6
VDKSIAYANRREACEFILGRGLKASDNVMKFCVHGGAVCAS